MITRVNYFAESLKEMQDAADLVVRFLEVKCYGKAAVYLWTFMMMLDQFFQDLPLAARIKFREYVARLEEEQTIVLSLQAKAWPEIADRFDFGFVPALKAFKAAVEKEDS